MTRHAAAALARHTPTHARVDDDRPHAVVEGDGVVDARGVEVGVVVVVVDGGDESLARDVVHGVLHRAGPPHAIAVRVQLLHAVQFDLERVERVLAVATP